VNEADWDRAVKLIDGAAEICLACHIRPDADALGSMLAVAQALRARGGPGGPAIVASFGDEPFVVPQALRFLPGTEMLTAPADYPRAPAVMLTFDAASADRLGLLQANAARAGELIAVDHHASNTGFGTLHLVDPHAAATAVLAADLISRLGVELTRETAFGIYAGLVTDTGSFRYPSTTPAVHELAARLLATGIEAGTVAQRLWDSAPFAFLPMLATVLGRARLEPGRAAGHGLVWTTVTRADRAAHGLPMDAVESVIDLLRRTDEADVAVVLKEDDTGRWQVSARSRGQLDVGRACVALGGGGHPLAAGFTADGPAAAAVAALCGQLDQGGRALGELAPRQLAPGAGLGAADRR
jgi:phosphoesterase RecJ-like protein